MNDIMPQDRKKKERVLIISQYDLSEDKHNMNAYQRIYYGSEHVNIALLIRRNRVISGPIGKKVRVFRAPFENRWLFLIYAVFFSGVCRANKYSVIITEPSGFAVVGFIAKFVFSYFWVLDVWDRPRWRAGCHESESSARVTDKVVYWLMRRADLYVLSVLPRAAKDIRPIPEKCIEFQNAIDLSVAAEIPPRRNPDDPMLHVAYAKSIFSETEGLLVLIKVAEELQRRKCPVRIHLVGEVSDESQKKIQSSTAANYFLCHGFIEKSRSDFFKNMHVGLVPYLAYEDLKFIFPIKVLEHLSQGNPVICSRLPGLCATIRDGYNGLLVQPGEPTELAEAIARLQENIDLWKKLARNSIDSVKEYDARKKNVRIFHEIIHRSRHRRGRRK